MDTTNYGTGTYEPCPRCQRTILARIWYYGAWHAVLRRIENLIDRELLRCGYCGGSGFDPASMEYKSGAEIAAMSDEEEWQEWDRGMG